MEGDIGLPPAAAAIEAMEAVEARPKPCPTPEGFEAAPGTGDTEPDIALEVYIDGEDAMNWVAEAAAIEAAP